MQALRFRIGERWLAVDVRHVREVCPFVAPGALPGAPEWLAGLVDLHGTLLPVADGGALLAGDRVRARLGARLLVLHGPAHDRPDAPCATFGLLVDGVEGVVTVDRGDGWTPSDGLPDLPFLREVARCDGRETLVLEVARLAQRHGALLEGSGALSLPSGGAREP